MNSQLLLHRTLLSGCEVKLPIYLPKHLVRSLISEHLCFGNAKSFWQQPGLLPEQWVLRFVRSQRLLGDPKFKSDWCKNKETSGPPKSGSFKFAQNSFRSDSFLSTYPVFSCQVWSLLVGQPVWKASSRPVRHYVFSIWPTKVNAKSGTSIYGGTWFQSYLGTGQPMGACTLFAKEERKLDLLTAYGYDLRSVRTCLWQTVSLSFWFVEFVGPSVCWTPFAASPQDLERRSWPQCSSLELSTCQG